MRSIYVDKNVPRFLAVRTLYGSWPGVIWSPLSHARVGRVPDPPLPGPRWVRVRNRQCGVCATDLTLLFGRASPGAAPVALPGNTRFYLGHEVVGEVVEVGRDVQRFRLGQRVVMESRFAGPNCRTQEIDPPCRFCARGDTRLCENASLRRGPVGAGGGWGDSYTAHEEELWPVPDGLSDDQASLVEPTAVALHAVLRRPPERGDHVLVVGAGIIGLLVTQAVRLVQPECHLTVLARHDHQAALAQRLGADAVLRRGDVYAQVASLTGAKHYRGPMHRGMVLGGFDVVYDCVSSATTVTDSLRWARAAGTVVLVGVHLEFLNVDLNPIWYQEVNLIGSHTFGPETWDGRRAHTFDLVMDRFLRGDVKDAGLITHRFPFEDYRKAIATSSDKRTGAIKVTFDLR